MILQLVQTYSAVSARYQVLSKDEVLYTGEYMPMQREIVLSKGHFPLYRLRQNPFQALKFSRQNPRSVRSMELCDCDGGRIGEIYLHREKGWNKPCWFQLERDNHIYRIYEVGLGKNGIKCPVYSQATQIGLLEKDPKVMDNLDVYRISVQKSEDAIVCILFGLYYDFVRFGNRGELCSKKVETRYIYTLNKEIRGMYDPTFSLKCSDEA